MCWQPASSGLPPSLSPLVVRFVSFCALVLFPWGVSACSATSGPPAVDAKIELADRYIFRGVPRVEAAVLQGWTSVALPLESEATASFSWWGNLNLEEGESGGVLAAGDQGQFSEVDVSPEYAWSSGDWSLATGLTSYAFPGQAGGTAELYASASVFALGVSPNVTAYYDIDEVQGLYLTGSVSRVWTLSERLQALVAGSLGFADKKQGRALYASSRSGLADLTSLLQISYAMDTASSWFLRFSSSTLAWGEFEDSVENQGLDPDSFTIALGASWSF